MNKLCDNCRKQGRVWCPHNAALEIKARLQPGLKREMFGPSPPFLFVGHNFYPKVYWGPLVSEQMVADDPSEMYGMSMEKIIETRASMVRGMKPGAVLVDLAADGGGNCELSRPGETVALNGVTILAPLNVAAAMPTQASLLFSRNLTAFVQAFTKDKAFQLDPADEIQQRASRQGRRRRKTPPSPCRPESG